MSFIITTLIAMYYPSPLPSLPFFFYLYAISSRQGDCLLPYHLHSVQQTVPGFGWSLINNTISKTCKKKSKKTSSPGLLTVMRYFSQAEL